MKTKDKFRKSYNSLKKEYRILQVEKSNGIEKVMFFDYTGAIIIARQNGINAPLQTFDLYPYKFYLIHRIYWFFLRAIKKHKTHKIHPAAKQNKPNTIISFVVKFWWAFIIPLSVIIIGFLIDRGIIDIGI